MGLGLLEYLPEDMAVSSALSTIDSLQPPLNLGWKMAAMGWPVRGVGILLWEKSAEVEERMNLPCSPCTFSAPIRRSSYGMPVF
jgi:hypothetical protein